VKRDHKIKKDNKGFYLKKKKIKELSKDREYKFRKEISGCQKSSTLLQFNK